MKRTPLALIGFISILALNACSGVLFQDAEEPALPGERISVLELQKSLEADDPVFENQGLITPAAWKNEYWPQNGGYPNHSMQNLSLNHGELSKRWKTSIGKGATSELPLVTQPTVV